ncbi:MAG: anion permease [Myxococcota bacterium]
MTVVVIVVVMALIFDLLNGMNDAANSIATIVSTKVLKPRQAVIMAAFCNFAALFVFELKVANTIGKGVVNPDIVTLPMVATGLISSGLWLWLTTFLGIPISASHSLVGGLIGPVLIQGGISALNLSGISKVVIFIFFSPLLGFVLGYILMVVSYLIVRRKTPYKVDSIFRKLQLISASLFSLSHGGNDAQKTMGIIAIALYSGGLLGDKFYVPYWVAFASYLTIAIGTYLGGWKVIETMGHKVTKLRPISGFSAETSAGLSIIFASVLGVPISTTHTIAGSIMGVGAIQRFTAVKWGLAGKLFIAWIITIPVTTITSALLYYSYKIIF